LLHERLRRRHARGAVHERPVAIARTSACAVADAWTVTAFTFPLTPFARAWAGSIWSGKGDLHTWEDDCRNRVWNAREKKPRLRTNLDRTGSGRRRGAPIPTLPAAVEASGPRLNRRPGKRRRHLNGSFRRNGPQEQQQHTGEGDVHACAAGEPSGLPSHASWT
jgi:hypothetical protein